MIFYQHFTNTTKGLFMKKLILLLVLSNFLWSCSNLPTDTDSAGIPPDIVHEVQKRSDSDQNSEDPEFDEDSALEANLWEYIPQGYGLTFPENERIENSIRRYLSYSSYFSKLSERATPYLYYIVKEIEKRDLPLEIALLPAIESFYNPKAYSHMGASGMWQFIATTAELFHLKRNSWYDGRRDIEASTQAALNYLEQLHKYFKGDWLKAIAAYNCGPFNVDKAVKKNRDLGKPTDFWSLDLPNETENYVPNLIALSKIIGDPEKYEIDLQYIENSPYFKKVKVSRQIDFSTTSKLANVSVDELKALNPGYKRRATPPESSHSLLLPIDSVQTFKDRFARLPKDTILVSVKETRVSPSHSTSKSKKSYKKQADTKQSYQKYRVRKGDTLGRIAKRYGTTVSELKRLNSVSAKRLKVGHYLKVSASNVAKVDRSEAKSSVASTRKYSVRKGDTLNQIAKRFGTTVSALRSLNRVSTKHLKVGKSLKIPTTHAHETKSSQKVSKRVVHTVKKGDNLWTIARSYDTSVKKLTQWNSLKKHTSLRLGQKIIILR